MIKISNIKLPINYNDIDILNYCSDILKINISEIEKFELLKKSVDARKKNQIFFILTVALNLNINEDLIVNKANDSNVVKYEPKQFLVAKISKQVQKQPIVVGTGPAGLFAAYVLACAGLNPLIIERGEKVEQRIKDVNDFWNAKPLKENSNVQFGEGGAGTFSDGKLNTGIKNENIRYILETFVKFGAKENILYDSKPHIGTDILRKVLVNFREEIESLGGEFLFNTTFKRLNYNENKVKSAIFESNSNEFELECETLILAIGHSARDTYLTLYHSNVPMIAKPFAVGARIEHTQDFINKSQYGVLHSHPSLPVADYKTAVHLKNGRSVFSFCMCPGGFVVNASSEQRCVVVNGMSNQKRDEINANSALLVNVLPDDFGNDPLAGIKFQQEIEEAAFHVSNSHKAVAQTLGSFLYGKENTPKTIKPSCKPSVVFSSIENVLPKFISDSLKEGILLIDKKIKGFADKDAILTAPETRSSSPVRILRNENLSSQIEGLYPCGEGAGYAGGITSSAVDGINVAKAVIEKYL